MFAGLEAGGWLQGDAAAEEALQKLHSSMSRLESSERIASAIASDAGGGRAELPGASALHLSADFAALLTRHDAGRGAADAAGRCCSCACHVLLTCGSCAP